MSQRMEEVWQELDELEPQSMVEITRGLGIRRKAPATLGSRGIPVLTLHYSADPRRDPETPEGALWVQRQRNDYPSQGDWDREMEIDDLAGGGELLLNPLLKAYAKLIIITDPAWKPNPRWDCVEGFDHGVSNATAMVKKYIDFNGDRYLCGEYYNWRRDPRGPDPGWSNEIWQNAPGLNALHALRKPRWCFADPSIFNQKSQAQKDGTFAFVNTIYRENGVKFLQSYPESLTRSDESYMTRLREHWGGLDVDGMRPTLYIVCRNETGFRQPGFHPYDCPNLLWEWRRRRRVELTDRQLLTRNQSDQVVQKDNHACDADKYCEMPLPRPTQKSVEEIFQDTIVGPTNKALAERGQPPLNPMSQAIAQQRFLALGAGQKKSKQVSMRNKARMLR